MGAFNSSLPIAGSRVEWVRHYGIFSTPRSYADRGTPETFLQIEWNWDDETTQDEERQIKLYRAEFKEQYDWLELNSVEKILSVVESA